MTDTKSPEYEKGYEDGMRDQLCDMAEKFLPTLRLAHARLEVSDYDGDEAEAIAAIEKAIGELEAFVS